MNEKDREKGQSYVRVREFTNVLKTLSIIPDVCEWPWDDISYFGKRLYWKLRYLESSHAEE